MIIAIDGPAGSGKSTIAKIVADRLGFTYIDTGAMYRAVTLYMLRCGVDEDNDFLIKEKLDEIELSFRDGRILLNDDDVTVFIRSPEITSKVSDYAKIDIIRKKLVALQRKIAEKESIVMEGRDIGTVVFKDADVKIFLVASVKERAKRRLTDLIYDGYSEDLESLVEEIKRRDKIDSTRKLSPLKKAKDAIEINTTKMSIYGVVDRVIEIVDEVSNG